MKIKCDKLKWKMPSLGWINIMKLAGSEGDKAKITEADFRPVLVVQPVKVKTHLFQQQYYLVWSPEGKSKPFFLQFPRLINWRYFVLCVNMSGCSVLQPGLIQHLCNFSIWDRALTLAFGIQPYWAFWDRVLTRLSLEMRLKIHFPSTQVIFCLVAHLTLVSSQRSR